MKIGIYDPYLDDLGGGEKYMMKIAECLSHEHEVVVFWDQKEDIEELVERFAIDLSKIKLSKNIFAKKVNILERLFETAKFDVIVVLSDGSIPLVLSRKLFLHFQQPMEHIAGLSWLAKFKLARVDSIFCNSYFTKSYIDKEFGIESLAIYPPVEIKAKKLKKENIILTVGRIRVREVVTSPNGIITEMRDDKKQTVITDVFKGLVGGGLKDWRLVLAVSVKNDEENLFEALRKRAQGFPVDFLVNKTNAELWNIYSRAKIYWHASGYGEDLEKHPEYAEHFGISTVEAMGAGAVPVVINAGGQKEIVEDGKNGFLWSNLEELQKRTLQLINDEALMEKMSKAAIERATVFSGDRFCREVREMIKR